MNSNSESLQNQLLRWLLAENAETLENTVEDCKENYGVNQQATDGTGVTHDIGSLSSADSLPPTFQLGEIPTVQERFQAVLKRRLKIQIENHPPLFPWESQLVDYPEYVDNPAVVLNPGWNWSFQQSLLNLPTNLPERVFQQLLAKCQGLIASSIPLGAKLVQAVEVLFPNEPQALNELAGMVLRTPYRSVDTLASLPILEQDYEQLQERQQMALSLIAAKQLLENLTLEISATQPVIERRWLTSAGMLNLRVESTGPDGARALRVRGDLPCSGTITVRDQTSGAVAQATGAGSLSLELTASSPQQAWILELSLDECIQPPLTLVINAV
ncbi:PatU [Calothrix sp. NIES-3974]|uniref:PatU n=1 Tax=Calothrix sp. NIES-3974 TaxID=2005462 RepID=UPI000B6097F7|nr:PatU [Calothrix sp. NIES-3974]BAZ04611.1 hypothetical protein NIES3974_12540 [Calothrix sp. NIES-3974]